MKISVSICVLMAALAMAGCSRSSSALDLNRTPPQPLPSVPTGNVASTDLEPVNPQQVEAPTPENTEPEAPTIGAADNTVETAALTTDDTTASAEPLKHEPLTGAWNVSSDSSQCRAILSFTQWSGGYRATTLRCNSPELSTVTAWDVSGPQVILKDSEGNQVASLRAAGTERYAGRTANGTPVSFSR